MLYYERKLKNKGYHCVIGVDEVGRGPLAGPVVAAAVVLKKWRFKNRIDDSKKLSARQRERAFLEIINKSWFGIGIINEKIIDYFNILNATRLAMEQAIGVLLEKLDDSSKRQIHLLIDGNVKPEIPIPFTNITKGDAKSKSIAAASIVAKVIRDRIMSVYDRIYPQYEFFRHKGYSTKKHRLLLKKLGPSLIHRTTFHVHA